MTGSDQPQPGEPTPTPPAGGPDPSISEALEAELAALEAALEGRALEPPADPEVKSPLPRHNARDPDRPVR